MDVISIDEESANKQQATKNWDKLSTLLDKTIKSTVHNLLKITVFFRFLSDEKTVINIHFS